MATERRGGDISQPAAENPRPVDAGRGVSGAAAVIVGLAALALAAMIGFFLLTQPARDDRPGGPLSRAAATVAGTVDRAAQQAARQPTR